MVEVILSLAGCTFMTLYLTGKFGGLNLHPQYFQWFPKLPWQFAEAALQTSMNLSITGYIWTGIGAGVMILLIYMQRIFFWWPLHPLGYLALFQVFQRRSRPVSCQKRCKNGVVLV